MTLFTINPILGSSKDYLYRSYIIDLAFDLNHFYCPYVVDKTAK